MTLLTPPRKAERTREQQMEETQEKDLRAMSLCGLFTTANVEGKPSCISAGQQTQPRTRLADYSKCFSICSSASWQHRLWGRVRGHWLLLSQRFCLGSTL